MQKESWRVFKRITEFPFPNLLNYYFVGLENKSQNETIPTSFKQLLLNKYCSKVSNKLL